MAKAIRQESSAQVASLSETQRIDLHVGTHIRARRKLLGISQERLADDLGLTFQQVQKYERGANRVSASKLYEIARSLKTTIASFFDGLPDPCAAQQQHGNGEVDPLIAFATAVGASTVMEAFPLLPVAEQKAIAALLQARREEIQGIPKAQPLKKAA